MGDGGSRSWAPAFIFSELRGGGGGGVGVEESVHPDRRDRYSRRLCCMVSSAEDKDEILLTLCTNHRYTEERGEVPACNDPELWNFKFRVLHFGNEAVSRCIVYGLLNMASGTVKL